MTGYVSRKLSPVSPAFAEPIPPSAHTFGLLEGSLRLVGRINLRSVSQSQLNVSMNQEGIVDSLCASSGVKPGGQSCREAIWHQLCLEEEVA